MRLCCHSDPSASRAPGSGAGTRCHLAGGARLCAHCGSSSIGSSSVCPLKAALPFPGILESQLSRYMRAEAAVRLLKGGQCRGGAPVGCIQVPLGESWAIDEFTAAGDAKGVM